MSISVTPWSSTQPRSAVSRLLSGSPNMEHEGEHERPHDLRRHTDGRKQGEEKKAGEIDRLRIAGERHRLLPIVVELSDPSVLPRKPSLPRAVGAIWPKASPRDARRNTVSRRDHGPGMSPSCPPFIEFRPERRRAKKMPAIAQRSGICRCWRATERSAAIGCSPPCGAALSCETFSSEPSVRDILGGSATGRLDRNRDHARARRLPFSVVVKLPDLARERRRFGYRPLLVLLRREGFKVNHKRLLRLPQE